MGVTLVSRYRLAIVGLAFALVLALAPTAGATTGPRRLQRLAVAQTQLLFRDYHGLPQVVSPPHCNKGQDRQGFHGVFLLPVLSFNPGDETLRCRIETREVLLDLGGYVPIEDARSDTYTLADGTLLLFRRPNLQAICNDVTQYLSDAPATLDGQPISATTVVTRDFKVQINRGANKTPGNPFYDDSVGLGHPGSLTACYAGHKALLRLSPGSHVISVDLSGYASAPTHLVYLINVEAA